MYRHVVNAFRTAYMRGWDAAVVNELRGNNPYHRSDSRRAWELGYDACDRGDAFPPWYGEWRQSRAGRRVSREPIL